MWSFRREHTRATIYQTYDRKADPSIFRGWHNKGCQSASYRDHLLWKHSYLQVWPICFYWWKYSLTLSLCVWFSFCVIHLVQHKFGKIPTKFLPLCKTRPSSFYCQYLRTNRRYQRITWQYRGFMLRKKLICMIWHWNAWLMPECVLHWWNLIFLLWKDFSFWPFWGRIARHQLFS